MELLINCLLVALLFAFIDALLYFAFRKTETPRYLKFKKEFFGQTVFIIPVLLLTMMYSYFLADREMMFECRKDTMLCVYSRSTEYDPTMRVAEKYDLSLVTRASISKHIRGKRSRSYSVDFNGKEKFKIPYSFSHSYEASTEADRFNGFLNSDRQEYAFMMPASDISFGRGIGAVAVFLLCALFIIVFFQISLGMLKDYFTKRKMWRKIAEAGFSEKETKRLFKALDQNKDDEIPEATVPEKIQQKENVIERSERF